MLDRRTILPGLFGAAALPATTALALRFEKAPPDLQAAADAACEAGPLHADLREAALDRAGKARLSIEQVMDLSRCRVCNCATLFDLPEDVANPRG